VREGEAGAPGTEPGGRRAAGRPAGGYRLVAFDVDGTLVDSGERKVVWQLLNQRFGGSDHENRERFQAYLRREISYAEWVDLDMGDWVAAGATREQIAEVIRSQLYLVPGARETVAALRDAGCCLAVISGTLDITLELLFPEHPFEEVFTNRIWFHDDGRIAGWRATPYDMEGKAQALHELAARRGVPPEATVYVGDNINDVQVLGAAGLAVAFEPKHPTVREAAHAVVLRDLRNLLPLVLSD